MAFSRQGSSSRCFSGVCRFSGLSGTVFALCDPELLHQVAKDLGLDLAAQTPPVALSTLPLARVLDALIAASVPDPGVESQVVSTELAQLLKTTAVPLATYQKKQKKLIPQGARYCLCQRELVKKKDLNN